jgi:hypothetical protein
MLVDQEGAKQTNVMHAINQNLNAIPNAMEATLASNDSLE